MIRALIVTAAAIAALAPMPGQRAADRDDGTYRNPILHADYSDPDAIRVGDDFYMIASSFSAAPGIPILHSRDLVTWTLVNHALPRLVPESAFALPQHGGGVWAPSLRHHAGRFWIFYPDPDRGIYLTTAANPRGRWSDPVLVESGRGLIDPCPLWDEDGRVYLVHAWARSRAGFNNVLTLHELTSDGTRTRDEGRVIIDGNTLPGYSTLEGPKLYKRGGWYYVFAPAGGVKQGWQSVFRARTIAGPYEDRIVLAQGGTDINGPHQGALVDTRAGVSWFIHFQDLDAYGRVVHLQPVEWHDGWPVIGRDDDGDGRGEPVRTFRRPIVSRARPSAPSQTTDEFDAGRLALQWQWQANPRPEWSSLTARRGWLRLAPSVVEGLAPSRVEGLAPSPVEAANLWMAPHLLLQKMTAPEFTATVLLDFLPRAPGERAGVIVFGANYAWTGLRQTADGVRLVMTTASDASNGRAEREVAGLDVERRPVYLRATLSAGAIVRFSYSFDNVTFTPIGDPFTARPGRWVGAKIGLFAAASAYTANRGYADFDWFRVTAVQ